ncbi:protein FAR1-RELATED SEQUENCE 5-like [Gossypium australe]|uniref:Protein FAR1-RELATED SEQUENCE 5-like n=1 Tax=Gossypium australe TaxID=47621 RepID=A0A5B6W899_9ROSI|nr:protein FAR1-RELATED SEQUENCE 5-like [Gossypium australe]
MMFQILQIVGQFSGIPIEDPHFHPQLFIEVSDSFKLAELNSLPPDFTSTWQELTERFLIKYFPPSKNAKLRNEITIFQQLDDESLYEA